jgi:hypothetical protein
MPFENGPFRAFFGVSEDRRQPMENEQRQGYQKLIALGIYLAFGGLVAAVVGLVVGLFASFWWVLWCGIGAFVAGILALLAGIAVSVRTVNNAMQAMWTPIQHIEDGGAVQIKRMDDGYFVVLSIGVTHLNLYVTPKMGDLARTIEVASFGLDSANARTAMSREERRKDDEQLLEQMRVLVGFPKSVEEVRLTAERLSQSMGKG